MHIILTWPGALAAMKAGLSSFQVFPNPHPEEEQAEGNTGFIHLSCLETDVEYDPRNAVHHLEHSCA